MAKYTRKEEFEMAQEVLRLRSSFHPRDMANVLMFEVTMVQRTGLSREQIWQRIEHLGTCPELRL